MSLLITETIAMMTADTVVTRIAITTVAMMTEIMTVTTGIDTEMTERNANIQVIIVIITVMIDTAETGDLLIFCLFTSFVPSVL